MKIQINGFDIELNTEESSMSLKVMDANGKELANNTYNQSSTTGEEIKQVEVPAAQDTQAAQPAQNADAAQTETPPAQDTAAQAQEDPQNVGEHFVPDFDTFKKLKKEGKI